MATSLGTVVVIGGGIAGASAGHALAETGACARLVLLEAEPQLAHHTTGRSAALLTENYGAGPIRPLTAASLPFLHDPPAELVDHPLLERRGIMTVATSPDEYEVFEAGLAAGATASNPVVEISVDEAQVHAPHVQFGPEHRVMWEAEAHDIDVAALHQAFVRGMRRAGAEIATSRRVDAATPAGDGWSVETTQGSIHADVLVNAAGAWGDVVAARAGIAPIGLRPLRRTAFMVTSPFEDSSGYAFVASAPHTWYLRPDGAQFLCSPADETPSEPCDAKPEEIDVARTIDLINENTRLEIRSVNSAWAGLRTFSPDRSMVLGPEPDHPSFVWCVGQGGTGIQTSPAAGALIADLVGAGAPGDAFAEVGLSLPDLLPDRYRN